MRVKCPNCGSAAQIELVWEDRDSYSTTKIKEYVCGCGCRFEVIFEAKKNQHFDRRNLTKGVDKFNPLCYNEGTIKKGDISK